MESNLIKFIIMISIGAIIFGEIAHLSRVGKIKYLRKQFKLISVQDISAYMIWGSAIFLTTLVLLVKIFGVSQEYFSSLGKFVISVTVVNVLFLAIFEYQLYYFVKNWWKFVVPIASVLGLIFSKYVNVYVDAEIIKYTKLNATYFPNAQNLIFLFLAPLMAIIFSLYGFLVFYFAHAFKIIASKLRTLRYLNLFIRNLTFIITGKKLSKHYVFNELRATALILGLLMMLLAAPILLENIVSKNSININKVIEETLVFSTYSERGIDNCENILDENIKITFIYGKGNNISAVRPMDNGSYQFFVDECKRKAEYNVSDHYGIISPHSCQI